MLRRSDLLAPAHPVTLALFRVAVCAVALASNDVHLAPRFAGLADPLRAAPEGLGLLAARWPTSPAAAAALHALVIAGCAAGLVGAFTRAALVVAALAALLLLGVPQFAGTVTHDHHLVWFLALCAASPCGDALSIDAVLRARRRGSPHAPSPSRRYAIPLRAAWALVACIYFFPGLWKWRAAGLAWALSDNPIHQMHWKWLQHAPWTPALRLDHYPSLCRALALGVMVFEVTFPLSMPWRATRRTAALAAIAFHLGTGALLRIRFTSLWLCYVMFLDEHDGLVRRAIAGNERLLAWAARRREGPSASPRTTSPAPSPSRGAWAGAAVGAFLVAGAAWAGARGVVAGWPFACYPTFQHLAGPDMPTLLVEAEDEAGHALPPAQPLLAARLGTERHLGLAWSLALRAAGPARDAAIADYVALLQGTGAWPAPPARVRVHRAMRPVDPDRRDAPPTETVLLWSRAPGGEGAKR